VQSCEVSVQIILSILFMNKNNQICLFCLMIERIYCSEYQHFNYNLLTYLVVHKQMSLKLPHLWLWTIYTTSQRSRKSPGHNCLYIACRFQQPSAIYLWWTIQRQWPLCMSAHRKTVDTGRTLYNSTDINVISNICENIQAIRSLYFMNR